MGAERVDLTGAGVLIDERPHRFDHLARPVRGPHAAPIGVRTVEVPELVQLSLVQSLNTHDAGRCEHTTEPLLVGRDLGEHLLAESHLGRPGVLGRAHGPHGSNTGRRTAASQEQSGEEKRARQGNGHSHG